VVLLLAATWRGGCYGSAFLIIPIPNYELVATRTGLTLPRDQVDALVVAGETMIGRDAGAITAFLEPGVKAAVMARRR
jgi:hypothetical protein